MFTYACYLYSSVDVGLVLLSCYLQCAKYIAVCYLLCFYVCTLFYFYTCMTHWYVFVYAVGLVELVSLIIMGVLCDGLHFYVLIGGVCVLLSGVKFT